MDYYKSKFIFFICLSIAILASLAPLLINYDGFFGLKGVKNQTIEDDVKLHITMTVELDMGDAASGYYIYYVEFELDHNSSVTDVEIERVNYRIYHNMHTEYIYNGIYYHNIIVTRGIPLLYRDNLTFQGSVDLNYQLNSIPQNTTLNYNLVYTNNFRRQDALGSVLLKYALTLIYIASFFLIPVILYFIIHPDFYEPSREEMEEIEEFFDNIVKTKTKENGTEK